MSLANLIVQPGRAVLQADAASFYPDGSVAGISSKLFACPEAKCAFSLRGYVTIEAISAVIARAPAGALGRFYANLAELASDLPDLFREATAVVARQHGRSAACLTLVGFDPHRGQPIGMLMTNDSAWFDGHLEPYRWVVVDNCIGSTDALDDLGITMADLSDPARFDIDRDSLPLIEAQRRLPWGAWPIPDSETAAAVRIGGWVDQAEVTADGVTVKRLVTWPDDREGERIAA